MRKISSRGILGTSVCIVHFVDEEKSIEESNACPRSRTGVVNETKKDEESRGKDTLPCPRRE